MVDTESFEKFEHIDATNSKTLFFSDLLSLPGNDKNVLEPFTLLVVIRFVEF